MEVGLGGVVAGMVAAAVTLWTHAGERRQREELLKRELELNLDSTCPMWNLRDQRLDATAPSRDLSRGLQPER